jgi:hypothetical protein
MVALSCASSSHACTIGCGMSGIEGASISRHLFSKEW